MAAVVTAMMSLSLSWLVSGMRRSRSLLKLCPVSFQSLQCSLSEMACSRSGASASEWYSPSAQAVSGAACLADVWPDFRDSEHCCAASPNVLISMSYLICFNSIKGDCRTALPFLAQDIREELL